MLHDQEHVSYVDADNPIPVLFGDITGRCRGLLGPALLKATSRPRALTVAVHDGGVREVEQVGPFGVVELQRPGQGVEDRCRDSSDRAALELGVVLDADRGT